MQTEGHFFEHSIPLEVVYVVKGTIKNTKKADSYIR